MKRLEEIKSLRDKTELELEDELSRAHADLFKFRSDLALRSLANVKSIRASRKRIARIMTLARERELASSHAEQH